MTKRTISDTSLDQGCPESPRSIALHEDILSLFLPVSLVAGTTAATTSHADAYYGKSSLEGLANMSMTLPDALSLTSTDTLLSPPTSANLKRKRMDDTTSAMSNGPVATEEGEKENHSTMFSRGFRRGAKAHTSIFNEAGRALPPRTDYDTIMYFGTDFKSVCPIHRAPVDPFVAPSATEGSWPDTALRGLPILLPTYCTTMPNEEEAALSVAIAANMSETGLVVPGGIESILCG
jgi:hypothetical protein